VLLFLPLFLRPPNTQKSKERGYSIFSNQFAVLSGALRDSLLVSSSSSVAQG
jgi:hypothetical protein